MRQINDLDATFRTELISFNRYVAFVSIHNLQTYFSFHVHSVFVEVFENFEENVLVNVTMIGLHRIDASSEEL